jgi:hypothetical protein
MAFIASEVGEMAKAAKRGFELWPKWLFAGLNRIVILILSLSVVLGT